MNQQLVAKESITIRAPIDKVWEALVDPRMISQYMFGTQVITDWKEGSPIVWKGEWKGKRYEDKGMILEVVPKQRIQYTHFSPLSGLPDQPENYHTVTIELAEAGGLTHVALAQDNNASEEARDHSEKNWGMMLASLKKLLEE